MEIPIMKIHLDVAIQKFEDSFENLLLEEDRNLCHIQDCQESIHAVKQTFNTLDRALQDQLKKGLK